MADARIGIQVTEERKRRWEDYVESDPTLKSLSSLIRMGVESHMNGTTGAEPAQTALEERERQRLEDIEDGVLKTLDSLSGFESQLNTLKQRVDDQSAIEQASERAYHILPTTEPFTDRWDRTDYLTSPAEVHPQSGEVEVYADTAETELRTDGYPENIATVLTTDTAIARGACEQLAVEVPSVKRTLRNGELLYWRDES